MKNGNKLWSLLAAVVTVLAIGQSASAQTYQPFIDADYFEPDLQFFAPADLDYFGDPPDATTGWFFTYDRVYWAVTRPENGPRPWDTDMTWGNRFDIGYMTENNGGWLFNYTSVNGPTGEAGSSVGETDSMEFNRMFRLEPFHHNGIVEPFWGVRYVNFTDYGYPQADGTNITPDIENHMVTGQLGVRAWRNFGHWKLSGDVRSFNGVNYQFYQQTEQNYTFVAAGEVRTEAQYNFTRDVALRVGWELMYFGCGIGRNNNLVDNSESLLQSGLTFGFTVNR